jgi:hypothetical protein
MTQAEPRKKTQKTGGKRRKKSQNRGKKDNKKTQKHTKKSTETGAAGRLKHTGTEAKESRREGCKQTRATALPPSTPSPENR